jgi:hypothetical protein
MKKMILISMMTLFIFQQPVMCGERDKDRDMESFLSNPKASVFQMTWHGGGSGKLEGMAVEPACLRVYEVRMLEAPSRETTSLGGSGAQYGRIEFADFGQTKFTCGLKKSSEEVEDPDVFFIDLNHNNRLEQSEIFKGVPAAYPPLDKIHYGAIDIPLHDRNQSRIHRVFVWYGKYDDLYLVSHDYMQGRIQLGGKEVTAVLVDYNCDGRYTSGRTSPEWIGTLDPRELDYDRIGWDADEDGKIQWTEQHFIGSYLICDGKVFQVVCTPDGRTLAVAPVEVPMGRLQMPAQNAFVRLVGDIGPMNLRITEGAIDVPAGTYRVDYLYIDEVGDNGDVSQLRKSGQYFEKPWEIPAGVTTKIYRDMCIITDRDKRNYEARMRELRGEGPQPRIVSLLREPLGNLDEFNISLDPAKLRGRRILICFWDMSQRPSRWCLRQLAKRKEELIQKEIVTIGIHTSEIDIEQLSNWLSENEVNLPVGIIKDNTQQVLQSWGVQARPWLILTNHEHIVTAEGFGLAELDAKIEETGSSASTPAGSNKITGLVEDPQGRPLSGVRVTEFQTDKDYTTDADGRFVSASAPSDERRFFFAVNRQRKLVGVGILSPGGRHVEVKLTPGKMISGTVVDPDGKPVAGAQVAPLPMTCFHVLTDKQGKFDLGWSPEWAGDLKEFFLMARHLGRNLAGGIEIDESAENVRIELEPALMLTGTVEEPNGVPIPGAEVGLSLRRGWACGTPVRKIITDEKGGYKFPTLLQRQEYINYAKAEGFWRNQITTGIINRITNHEQVGPIILKRPNLSVSGTVLNANGQLVAGIPMYLEGEGQPGLDSKTDAEGKFIFEKVCSGPVQISAKNNTLFGTIETEGGAKNVKLVVRPRFE